MFCTVPAWGSSSGVVLLPSRLAVTEPASRAAEPAYTAPMVSPGDMTAVATLAGSLAPNSGLALVQVVVPPPPGLGQPAPELSTQKVFFLPLTSTVTW